MKKILFALTMAALSSAGASAETQVKYGDLIVYRQFLKNYIAEMHVDGNVKTRLTLLRDASGNKLKFASEADALNYMSAQGWELVSVYNRNHSETHFILKKDH